MLVEVNLFTSAIRTYILVHITSNNSTCYGNFISWLSCKWKEACSNKLLDEVAWFLTQGCPRLLNEVAWFLTLKCTSRRNPSQSGKFGLQGSFGCWVVSMNLCVSSLTKLPADHSLSLSLSLTPTLVSIRSWEDIKKINIELSTCTLLLSLTYTHTHTHTHIHIVTHTHKHTYTETLALYTSVCPSISLSLTHILYLTHTFSHTHMSTPVFLSLTHTHTHTHTHTQSHTHTFKNNLDLIADFVKMEVQK